MVKKKRKAQKRSASKASIQTKQEIAEEILALSSIFSEEFCLHDDAIGFQLSVVPHPGSSKNNHTFVDLVIRYTAGYPGTPLQLRLDNVVGLSAEDTKLLSQELQDAATAYARENAVCVFNLVGQCQEFLLERNDVAEAAAYSAAQKQLQDAEATAAEASGTDAGTDVAAQSLWHEMQLRMQQQAAERVSELSVGPGLSSNVLGEDLWMFDGGLFAEEGESAYTVPNISSPRGQSSNRSKRSSSKAAESNLEPPSRLKSPGQLQDMPPAASPSNRGALVQLARATGKTSVANGDAVRKGKQQIQRQSEAATLTAADRPAEQPVQPPQLQQPLQVRGTTGSKGDMQRLLLAQNHSCSFHNLPKRLQRLLTSQSNSKDSKGRRPRKQNSVNHRQQAPAAAGSEVPVFGDFDTSTMQCIAIGSGDSSSKRAHPVGECGQDRSHLSIAAAASPSSPIQGDVFQSCMSDSEPSRGSDSGSESESESDTSCTGSITAACSAEDAGREDEGVNLRSQLLTGYLLLLAARVQGSGAAGSSDTVQPVVGARHGSSLTAAPVDLQPLADHLRRVGLLPNWVHWLLQQLPQRPELFERAFTRLFQQEIQESSRLHVGPGASAEQLLQAFWQRQAQAASADSSTSHGMAVTAEASALTAAGGGKQPPGSATAIADALQSAGAQAAAVHSRYKSDFQELHPLGRGGFGIVVAAINRLDGRKYAVKKIKLLPSGGSSSYSRILREVATLSRLQHPNVVRYFQAWTEQASHDSEFFGESDGGEWGTLDSSDYSGDAEDERDTSDTSNSNTDDDPSRTGGMQGLSGYSVDDDSTASALEAANESSTATRQWASGVSVATTTTAGSSSGSGSGIDSSSEAIQDARLDVFGQLEFSIPPRLPAAAGTHKQYLAAAAKARKSAQVAMPAAGHQHSHSTGPSQILYIQMEFCPRTLAQVLEVGGLDEADAWLVLRGILAGLAHIHAQGAIHRDLKPANIFYDSKGEIKLGDFGLAKFNTAAAAAAGTGEGTTADGAATGRTGSPRMDGLGGQRRMSSVGAHVVSATAPSDVTGMVGTGLYISPEIANGWANYDEKVDLYSLGVIVFEMWHPFATAMERLAVLRELRETHHVPSAWEAAHPQVARLVRWLMSPKPADRPSARQVLQSDLLPPRLEDEQLKDLLRSLPDNPVAYERVIDSLFSIGSNRELKQKPLGARQVPHAGTSASASVEGGPAGLMGSGLLGTQQAVLSLSELPGAPLDSHLELEDAVCKVVKNVCAVHGAVQMSSTGLGLSHAALPKDAVRFLAPSGAQMALRYEVRYPLAVWFAQQAAMVAAVPYGMASSTFAGSFQQQASTASALERGLKRFEVCRVKRSGRGGRSMPASYLQADFDVFVPAVSGARLRERMLGEAEVIKVATQVLDALPELGSYEVRLGHTQLFAAAIAGMCLPAEVAPSSVMALLSSAISISAASTGSSTAGPPSSTVQGGSSHAAQSSSAADRTAASAPSSASTASSSSSTTGRVSMWAAIRAGLDGLGLDAKPVSRCRQCTLKLPGPLSTQLSVLRSFLLELRPQLGSTGLAAATAAVDELTEVGQLLVDWGLAPEQILLEPLLTPPSEYFGGVLFQVLFRSPPTQSGTVYTSAVAAGGRYDSLLRSLWSPAAATMMPAPGAVGVSINCEKLAKALMQRGHQRGQQGYSHGAVGGSGVPGGLGLQGGRLHTGQCDVLVCAKGGDGVLQLRMQLLSHLWSSGISAALLPREAPSLTEQYEYAHDLGARWLVILDDKFLGPDQLIRVKSLERKGEDTFVHIADLGRCLQLGLSGAQDPGRSIAAGLANLTQASGHWGLALGAVNGVGGSSSGMGTGTMVGQGHRQLLRFASEARLGSGSESVDAEFEVAGSREREGGMSRDREAQTGRHRDRRR